MRLVPFTLFATGRHVSLSHLTVATQVETHTFSLIVAPIEPACSLYVTGVLATGYEDLILARPLRPGGS